MDKHTVPKFGSFKPKSVPEPPPAERKRFEQADELLLRRGHVRHTKYDSRRYHDQEYRPSIRRSKGCRSDAHQTPVEPSRSNAYITRDELNAPDLFVVDRRGDLKNVEYASLHRYSIPTYRTVGYGHVIGIPCSAKIDGDRSNEKEVVLTSSRLHNHKRSRLLTSNYERANERRLRFVTSDSAAADDNELDFIDFQPPRQREIEDNPSHVTLSESPSISYRSVEGNAKDSVRPEDNDLAFASDSDAAEPGEDTNLRHRRNLAVLSNQAKSKPTELDRWLVLVEHQAGLFQSTGELVSPSQRGTLAELRLSILNKASKHIVKGSHDRSRLLYATIQEGSMIWDFEKLSAKWQEALAECPTDILLWTKYLDFVQHNHSAFSYERCKRAYIDCLRVQLAVGAKAPADSQNRILRLQTRVLLRLTNFVREAGYNELAIAIWQSSLDFIYFRPSRLHDCNIHDTLSSFGEYWESEAPRLGEEAGQSWAQYERSDFEAQGAASSLRPRCPDPSRPFASFAELEGEVPDFMLPARLDDDEATRDPFRSVMFSDLQEVLESLPAEAPKDAILNAFLVFHGLPPMPQADGCVSVQPWLESSGPAIPITMYSDSTKSFQQGIQPQYRWETTSTLFDDAFYNLESAISSERSDGAIRARYLERTLEALVTTMENDELAEYFVAFKLKLFPDEAAQTAKRLLKARPSSMRLYNSYALVEVRLGRSHKARDVWSTALKMRDSLGEGAQDDAVILWHSRLLAHVRAKDDNAAFQSLLGASSPTLTSCEGQFQQLKVTKDLQRGLDHMLLRRKYGHASIYADCLVWLSYLSSHYDIASALQAYEIHTDRISREESSLPLELLQQSKCTLIEIHMQRRRPYRPAVLRHELEAALDLFPSNTIILSLHSNLAAQDRLRSLAREQKISDPTTVTIVQWLFKLSDEVRRVGENAAGSTVNTVRATFSKALLHPESAGRHSPALWMAWLQFEHGVEERLGRGFPKTKQVFLDGLRDVPWCKQWFVVGMKYLCNGGMSERESRQVYGALVENGLRVRVDIEALI